MKKTIKKLFFLILIFSFVFCTSCKKEVTNVPVVDGKEVVYGQNINLFSYYPDTLNPYTTGINKNFDMLMLIYEGLFAIKGDGQAEGILAADYMVSEDEKKYTIILKENVKFHNGKIFDAKDVIFTLDYIKEYAPNFLYIFENVENYYANENKVIFELKNRQFNFITRLDFPVMPSSTIISVLNEDKLNMPVGTGPFKYQNNIMQKELMLIKNDEYHISGIPYLNSVTFKFLKDPSVAVSAFNNNEISVILSDEFVWGDVSFNNQYAQIDFIGENFYFMAFNYENELLNDINIRKMLLRMIDKKSLSEKVFQSKADLTNSTLNPRLNYGGFYADLYSKEECALLAKKSGFTDKDKNGVWEKMVEENWYSTSFSVLVNADDDKLLKIADFLLQNAKDSKISLDIKRLSGEEYIAALEDGDYDIVIAKEKITSYNNLAQKIDFDGKYQVPYEMYLSLNSILNEVTYDKPYQKLKEFDDAFKEMVPYAAICYDTNSILWHHSIKNMSDWQKARLKGVTQSFVSFE